MASGVVMAGHVSTHSRPKAAGPDSRLSVLPTSCFNSQPPEGGWVRRPAVSRQLVRFNSQPPEGGWLLLAENRVLLPAFQLTAARRRLGLKAGKPYKVEVFQLTAARRRLAKIFVRI